MDSPASSAWLWAWSRYPRITVLQNDPHAERHFVRRLLLYSMALFAAVVLALQAVLVPVIRLTFGSDFLDATECARWMIVASAFLGLRRVMIAVLQGRGRGGFASIVELALTPVMAGGIILAAALESLVAVGITMLAVGIVSARPGFRVARSAPAEATRTRTHIQIRPCDPTAPQTILSDKCPNLELPMSSPLPLPIRVLVKGSSTVNWTSWSGGPRTDFIFPRVIEERLLADGRPCDVQTVTMMSGKTSKILRIVAAGRFWASRLTSSCWSTATTRAFTCSSRVGLSGMPTVSRRGHGGSRPLPPAASCDRCG